MKILTLNERAVIAAKLRNNTTYKDSCWIFKHANGITRYGQLRYDYKLYQTHRLSAAIFLGLDLDNENLQVNHKSICISTFCWNPDHLYIGTQADNMRDVSNKIRTTNKYCTRCGHLKTTVNTIRRGKRKTQRVCNFCRNEQYKKSRQK